MSRIDQSLAANFQPAVNKNAKLSARQLCEALRPTLDQARDLVKHEPLAIDSSAKALKELAMGYCHTSTQILEKMQAGSVEVGGYGEPQLASQIEWRDNIAKASYSMFAAGALEGTQAFEVGLGPRAYNVPASIEGGKFFHILDGVAQDLQDRARWVTYYAEEAKADKGPSTPQQIDFYQQQLDGLDRHIPKKERGEGLSYGHINEVMRASYEYGVHAGILHGQDKL